MSLKYNYYTGNPDTEQHIHSDQRCDVMGVAWGDMTKNAAEMNHDLRPVDVNQAYNELRKRGEIYSYESGDSVVVKVTDDVIA